MFLSKLFNKRGSLLNLSRPSSFATRNAPEADLGSQEEGGNMQASLKRSILRTQAQHSQQKMKSRHQVRRSSQDCKKSCATFLGSHSSNGAIAVGAGKMTGAEMMSFAFVLEALCPLAQFSGSHEKLTVSGSVKDVPLSTAKKSALLWPPLFATESQRDEAARQNGTTASTSLRARWQ